MSVLVTGAAGFVGLALVEHRLARGENVVGVDPASPPPEAHEAFAALPGRFDATEADVRDADALRDTFARHAPDRLVAPAAVTADAARERRGRPRGVARRAAACASHGQRRGRLRRLARRLMPRDRARVPRPALAPSAWRVDPHEDPCLNPCAWRPTPEG
jgi:uncharacterized protein YbjT (DUF2867 family)